MIDKETREMCATWVEKVNNPSTIRLHAGELSAQEMRTTQAVLKWIAYELHNLTFDPR